MELARLLKQKRRYVVSKTKLIDLVNATLVATCDIIIIGKLITNHVENINQQTFVIR